jgi:cytochrome c biogenesis protein CcdA/thiol-disulfide isomerase/thioredoxin
MAILIIFAFLAGIVTVLSPCVLPVLPAILAAGTGKGRYRYLGIIVGFTASFIFFTLALTALVQATGISANFLRYLAIFILIAFGIVMIFPKLGDLFSRSTSAISDLGEGLQARSRKLGTGFFSGLLLGLALGLVWTPCAGPILAAITTLVATHAISQEIVLITFAYTLGSALPMLLIAFGGSKALTSSRFLSKHAEGIRQGFGVLMIATALAIAFNYDSVFQQYLLTYVPLVEIEDTPVVKEQLAKLRLADNNPFAKAAESTDLSSLPKIAGAPDFVGITHWLNSDPLTMSQLRGKVVLIDFWTYSCINCVRTLPYVNKWYDTYHDKGFVVVGIHSPEFEFEKDTGNVADAIKRFHIHYPVAQDNNLATWQAYSNIYWPAHYLIDQNGIVRQVHFGEGGYLETENAIRSLLGLAPLEGKEVIAAKRAITPETYLGYKRAAGYASEENIREDQTANYSYSAPLPDNKIGLKGLWEIKEENIISKSDASRLELNFIATRVYLVLGGHSTKPIRLLLDGKPLPKEYYTKDMDKEGNIIVKEARMYDLINLKGHYGRHLLTLEIPKGIETFAFTFGNE